MKKKVIKKAIKTQKYISFTYQKRDKLFEHTIDSIIVVRSQAVHMKSDKVTTRTSKQETNKESSKEDCSEGSDNKSKMAEVVVPMHPEMIKEITDSHLR